MGLLQKLPWPVLWPAQSKLADVAFKTKAIALAVKELFSPASLFAANEPGVWYDPSDMSTLFQDAAGTTPVTAVGQQVGLILDKSKLGPELVSNGTFDADVAGWSSSNGAIITWDAGKAKVSFTSTGDPNIRQVITQPAGYSVVTATITRNFTGATSVHLSLGAGVQQVAIALGETITLSVSSYRASAGAATVVARTAVGIATGDFTIDNISVRELPGNHASQATSTARPVLQIDGAGKYHLLFDGIDDFLVTPTIPFNSGAVTSIIGTRKTGGRLWVDIYDANNTANGYWAVGERGSFLKPHNVSGVGSPIYQVNKTNLGESTRNELYTLGINNNIVLTTTGLVLPSSNYNISGYSGAYINGRVYSVIMIGRQLTAQEIDDSETWVNGKTGAY